MPDLAIEYLPLAGLTPYARNARTHSPAQVAQLVASIREFGWTNPVLVDEADGIIAGHGRVMAAQQLGIDPVPCIRLAHLTDAQRRAYVLADNRLALNAGWDDALLAQELAALREQDYDLGLTGFLDAEINALLESAHQSSLAPDSAGENASAAGPAVTRPGDVWRLGQHLLLCGDSSSDRGQFLATHGVEPDLLVFDPPYDCADAWTWTVPAPRALVFTDNRHIHEAMRVVLTYPVVCEFVWDTVISWYVANRPMARHRSCFYCAAEHDFDSDRALLMDGKKRDVKTIDGGSFGGEYDYVPLPAGMVRLTSCYQKSKTADEAGHGKPVEWLRALLSGAKARVIFDPFAGNGTTLLAAPQGAAVYAIEIEPAKVDAIVRRWCGTTGGEARHAATGTRFPS